MRDRVLVAVADPAGAGPLRRALAAAGFEVAVVDDGLEAVERAMEWLPDGVVLDVALPTIDGLEVLRRIRRDHRTWWAVVILLAADQGEPAGSWNMEPDDFVHPPIDPDDLVARLTARIHRVRSALGASWAYLPGSATIEGELREAIEAGRDIALHVIDLDEFKAFNDRYGFVRGNRAIALVARIVQSVAADVDPGAFAGHIGGDDFVLITTAAAAIPAAEAVIERFDTGVRALYDPEDLEAGFVLVRDRRRRISRHRPMTISIGIATTATRRYRHIGEMAQVAAEMEAQAKRDPSSSYRIDRRSGKGNPPS
jgi:diguanylate cyclase (GGDEF)-like protein